MQLAALLAVGAAAISLVAGLGTYLFIRFTQHRGEGPGGRGSAAPRPSSPEERTDR